MGARGEVALVAVIASRPRAADLVRGAWDAGEAVAVLDPDAPRAVTERVLRTLAPTHLVADDGRRSDVAGIAVPEGTAAVALTSGTTGAPKGIELTVEGAAAIGPSWAGVIGHEPDDHWLVCLPLHHTAGLAILARARGTGAAVTVHPAFDIDAVARAPATVGATIVSVVPTMLRRLLDADAPLHRFRRVVSGAAPLPATLRARAEETGVPLVDAYGLSETWGGFTLDGVVVPDARVRLGAADEIEVAGPMVMRGYLRDPDATQYAFTGDGYFRTGDVGRLDPDGRLRVVDRLRDLVITGGVNVSPVEVEHVLAEHPAVADVAVVGAPDDEWGERVVAHVVARDDTSPPTLDALRAFASDQLAAPKLPREIVIVDAIPRSPGGKTLRSVLRDTSG